MDTPTTAAKDKRVEIAIHHWAPRFVSSGVPLTDFEDVTAGISLWDEWCAAWSARAAIHEELGRTALADGMKLSAGEHLTRAALCYHFGKFILRRRRRARQPYAAAQRETHRRGSIRAVRAADRERRQPRGQ